MIETKMALGETKNATLWFVVYTADLSVSHHTDIKYRRAP